MSHYKPPILIIHGVFGRPALLDPWVQHLTRNGYDCHVPTLPGRDPTSLERLRRTSVDDFVDAAIAAYDAIGEPAIVIGHSMGGLVCQRLASVRNPAALVLLASIPPGVLWPQVRMLPHLFPALPSILSGQPFLPSPQTMRSVPLYRLPAAEQAGVLLEEPLKHPDTVGLGQHLQVGGRRLPAHGTAVPQRLQPC